ncbi:TPA: hypothetical protein DCZ17_00145 [Candidatus Collierbacteria bacterium]|nr:hypothetical protein [Candidatus Collierbacteria bacterium]
MPPPAPAAMLRLPPPLVPSQFPVTPNLLLTPNTKPAQSIPTAIVSALPSKKPPKAMLLPEPLLVVPGILPVHFIVSKINNRRDMKKGFTLIELLVVSTIIITLIGIGSVSYVRALQTSRDSRRKTDLEQIRQALETYRSENGSYPTTATWKNSGVLYPTYLTTIPSDPKAGYLYGYIRTTATTYVLCAALEVTTTPISCGTGTCGTGTCSYAATNP